MLSGQCLQRSLFAAFDAILGAIVTSHIHRSVMSQPKWRNNTHCLSALLCRLRITTQFRSDTVDKMANIFIKRTWQPYIHYTKRNGSTIKTI